jgi:adenylate cyclase
MTGEPPAANPASDAMWHEVLNHGNRTRWAALPSDLRCNVCAVPLEGVSGRVVRMFTRFRPARMSPNFCNFCEELMPLGGAEVDTAVLFADLRDSTTMGENLSPAEFAALLNRFYHATSHVLIAAQSMIDKLVGDEIMALYVPAMGADYRERAVVAGIRLLQAVGYTRDSEP